MHEASGDIGGLSRSFVLWGQPVDLGPHRFFSKEPRVAKLWNDVVADDARCVNRLTRIYFRGQLVKYPLALLDVICKVGIKDAFGCLGSYLMALLQRSNKSEVTNFEDWVSDRFGRRLFELFFKSYSEKLWGIKCTQLDADFAKQRIKSFSLGEAIKGFFVRRHHATLVDRFSYPTKGSGSVYEKMAQKISLKGNPVFLQSPITKVYLENNKVVSCETEAGEIKNCDQLISTMPLTKLLKSISPPPPAHVLKSAELLKFRSTVLVYLKVHGPLAFEDQWLYIHSDNVKVGRITNFKNWPSAKHVDFSILCLEYWCNRDDAEWSYDDKQWKQMARTEIVKLGFAKDDLITDEQVVRIPFCYPIYSIGYKKLLEPIMDYINSIKNLTVIGRYGAFKYNNQDHSLLMGLLAAENIALGTHHKLWEINTDSSYQEAGPAPEAIT